MIQYLSLILIYKIHLRLTICPGLKYLNIFRYVTVIDEFPSFHHCMSQKTTTNRSQTGLFAQTNQKCISVCLSILSVLSGIAVMVIGYVLISNNFVVLHIGSVMIGTG